MQGRPILLAARLRWHASFLLFASSVVSPAPAAAQLLPPVTPVAEKLDPQARDGDAIARGAPPDARGWPSACAFRVPVCVHAEPPANGDVVLAALASVEHAWEAQRDALHLPTPDPGETGAYHVYLVDRTGLAPGATLVAARDVRSAVDRASAFSLVDRAATGCALDAALARELARASIYRMAPATDETTARAEASYLARLVVPCAMSLPDGVEVFQAYPERAIADEWPSRPGRIADAYARGAALFFWWLDFNFGEEPGDMLRGVFSLSATETPADASSFRAHPNVYDVLRSTFVSRFGAQTSVDDLYARFAVARAFMGSADDGAHLPETRALGDAARVSLAFADLPWPAEPHAYASADPVAQTGAAYLTVRRESAPAGSNVQVEAKWEDFTRMRWVVVLLDDGGRDIGESVLGGFDRGTDARVLVRGLSAASTVLVVGVSLGNFMHRYDPADGAPWAHGWTVSFYPK